MLTLLDNICKPEVEIPGKPREKMSDGLGSSFVRLHVPENMGVAVEITKSAVIAKLLQFPVCGYFYFRFVFPGALGCPCTKTYGYIRRDHVDICCHCKVITISGLWPFLFPVCISGCYVMSSGVN